MDKYYSYTDFLRAVGQYPKQTEGEQLLNDIYLDLFLAGIQREQRVAQLTILIDEALDKRDERAFYTHCQELQLLQAEAEG